MHACNVVVTLLQNEQVNFVVGVFFSVHRDHPRLRVSVQGVFRNQPLHLLPLPQGVLWRVSGAS